MGATLSGPSPAGARADGAAPTDGAAATLPTESTLAPRLTFIPPLKGELLGLPDDALDEVVHALERDVGLLLLDARRDHDLAGVVLERTLVDDHRAGHELGLGLVGLL